MFQVVVQAVITHVPVQCPILPLAPINALLVPSINLREHLAVPLLFHAEKNVRIQLMFLFLCIYVWPVHRKKFLDWQEKIFRSFACALR